MIHETTTAVQRAPEKDNSLFDPLENLFVAQSNKPGELNEINLRVLSPFHRSLLVIDGTVTKFIEAYTMEPVDVVRLAQHFRQLPSDHEWLEAPVGIDVIARQVLLRGHYSNRLYAYAVSLVIPSRLPQNIQDDLEFDGESIGRILNSSKMETRREVLWYGQEKLKDLPAELRELSERDFMSRTYRIITNKQPIMLINEKFPNGEDPFPYHH